MAKSFLILVILFFYLSAVGNAEEASLCFETGILEVPRVVTEYGDFYTEFQLAPDGKLSLTKAWEIISKNIGDSSINGKYDGVRDYSGWFNTDSIDTTVEISGKSISLVLDAFFGGECRLAGTIANDHSYASGSYQCADFTSGKWLSRHIRVENEILTSIIEFSPDSQNSFSSRTIGLKY